MAGKIICFMCCFILALILFFIAEIGKNSDEPITFLSGDESLKSKLNNISEYNKEMSLLYKKCSLAVLVTGAGFIVMSLAGLILLAADCTVGIYFVYRCYKNILKKYSESDKKG